MGLWSLGGWELVMMGSKKKIYGFSNTISRRGDRLVVAISEDGDILATHVSSSDSWGVHDLGMDGRTKWKHDVYDASYPDGWECEYVPFDNRDEHKGLQEALRLNSQLS